MNEEERNSLNSRPFTGTWYSVDGTQRCVF